MHINGVNNKVNSIPMQKVTPSFVGKVNVPIGSQKADDKDDFYAGMVKFTNKVPEYTGPASMGNYLDYLVNCNVL